MIIELPCGHAYDTELVIKHGPNSRGAHNKGDRVHECHGLKGTKTESKDPMRFIITAEATRHTAYTVRQVPHPEANPTGEQ